MKRRQIRLETGRLTDGFKGICAVAFLVVGLGGAHPSEASVDPAAWTSIETRNFVLMTDGSPRRGAEIARRLEELRSIFARLAPSLELQSPAPTTLFAFRNAESYAPFKTRADRGRARTLGQFIRALDGNYLTLDASASSAGSYAVLYHEYVHFLVTHNFPKVPLWFNEGLAEYYSTFEIEEGKVVLGLPVERHLRWLESESDFSLDELIEADSATAAAHDADEVGRFYAMSWLLVHYLLSGGDEEIDSMVDYFLRLREGEDPSRAFEGAFDRHLSSMAGELRTYAAAGNYASVQLRIDSSQSSKPRSRAMAPADVLYHLGDLSIQLRKLDQGEKLFHQALDRRPRHGNAHAGLAYIRDLQGRYSEAESLYRDAMAGGSLGVLAYLRHGRHAVALADSGGPTAEVQAKRARKSLAEAVSLLPSFGEAHGLLAAAEALPGGDLKSAQKSIKRARKLLPGRADLTARHIQILLKDQRVDQAEQLLQDTLQAQTDDFELIGGLWEDVDRIRLILKSNAAFEKGNLEDGLMYFDEAVSMTSDEDLRLRLETRLLALQEEVARVRKIQR